MLQVSIKFLLIKNDGHEHVYITNKRGREGWDLNDTSRRIIMTHESMMQRRKESINGENEATADQGDCFLPGTSKPVRARKTLE